MENITGQVINGDEGIRCINNESYNDEQDLDDDNDLSRSIDCNGSGKSDGAIEKPIQSSPTIAGDIPEPFIGMEFKSRDEAHEYYVAYGRRTGFTVRIHHNRRSRINHTVIGQDFVCSKEGFREKKYVYRKDRVLPPPPITREGCAALLRIALRDGVKWVITKFVKEHNHPLLSPSKVPWRVPAKNSMSEDEKDKRIRELTMELYNEKQRCKRRCTAYREQLLTVLKDLEEHNDLLLKRVEDVVRCINEVEKEAG